MALKVISSSTSPLWQQQYLNMPNLEKENPQEEAVQLINF